MEGMISTVFMIRIARYFLATIAALVALYMDPGCDTIFTTGITPRENYSIHVCATVALIVLFHFCSQLGFRYASALTRGKFILYLLGTLIVFQDKGLAGDFPLESVEGLLEFRWQLESQWLKYTDARQTSLYERLFGRIKSFQLHEIWANLPATSLLNAVWLKAHPECIAHAGSGAQLGRYVLAFFVLLGAVSAVRPVVAAKSKRE